MIGETIKTSYAVLYGLASGCAKRYQITVTLECSPAPRLLQGIVSLQGVTHDLLKMHAFSVNLFSRSTNLFEIGRNPTVALTLTAICIAALCVPIFLWNKRTKHTREMERHSISAEDLESLLASNPGVLLLDVRQPLDLLAYPEIIAGAKRIPSDEVLANPSLLPKDKDIVIYCTCPSDKTSWTVLRRAQSLDYVRIRVLRGGLAAWKAKGYPVKPYQEVFHLYSQTVSPKEIARPKSVF